MRQIPFSQQASLGINRKAALRRANTNLRIASFEKVDLGHAGKGAGKG